MAFALLSLTAALSPPRLGAEIGYRILGANDLAALTSQFEPGDFVLLPDATWENQTLVFRGKGTPEKPITLRAINPGKFVLTGKSSLVVDGEWLVVEGVTLRNAGTPEGDGFAIKGRNNRLTACVVDGSTHKFAVHLYGAKHRVDHCYFANKTSDEPTLQIEVDANEPNYHRIDRNHFGYRAPQGRTGGETIRVGFSSQPMIASRTTVEQNLFERCDGGAAIISSQSGENTYRENTFHDCDGVLTLRRGGRNVVDGNLFVGGHKPNPQVPRIVGEDHVITNNQIDPTPDGPATRRALTAAEVGPPWLKR